MQHSRGYTSNNDTLQGDDLQYEIDRQIEVVQKEQRNSAAV